jgi:hypothetical protein
LLHLLEASQLPRRVTVPPPPAADPAVDDGDDGRGGGGGGGGDDDDNVGAAAAAAAPDASCRTRRSLFPETASVLPAHLGHGGNGNGGSGDGGGDALSTAGQSLASLLTSAASAASVGSATSSRGVRRAADRAVEGSDLAAASIAAGHLSASGQYDLGPDALAAVGWRGAVAAALAAPTALAAAAARATAGLSDNVRPAAEASLVSGLAQRIQARFRAKV